MLVVGHLIHEWEEETHPERIPGVKQNVLVFFRLEERNAVDLELAKRTAVEFIEQAVYMSAQFFVEAGKELCDLLLGDRGSEIDIPGCQAGEGFGIAGKQAMEKGGSAAQISQNEKRLFDTLSLMTGKKDVIQKETQPVDELSNGPDGVEKKKENDSPAGQAGGSFFSAEKRTVGCSPKEAEIVEHSD